MVPSHQPSHTTAPARSGGRGLAWASLVLSLIFPLTYLVIVLVVVLRSLTPSGANPFVVSLYTVFDYVEWPLPILAVILGHAAIARGESSRGVARVALVLGYLSIIALVGIVIALVISSAPHSR